jgi:hypothetical protein
VTGFDPVRDSGLYCERWEKRRGVVLEIFGDVFEVVGVFDALLQGVKSLLYQQGALWVLSCQGPPHHLQVLWAKCGERQHTVQTQVTLNQHYLNRANHILRQYKDVVTVPTEPVSYVIIYNEWIVFIEPFLPPVSKYLPKSYLNSA